MYRNAMISVLNRVAMAAHSRGRKPTDPEQTSFLSRECGGSTSRLGFMLPPHSRLQNHGDRLPWADAHGYVLPSLRD